MVDPDVTTRVILHPIGILLALLFVGSMTGLFVWMFHVPPVVPHEVVRVRQSVSALNRILVPTVGAMASERAVELACRLGQAQKAEIILVHVIEVPFSLDLNAALPRMEEQARETLETAKFIVMQHGLPVRTRVLRNRLAADGILQAAREEDADAIVMGLGVKRRPGSDQIGRTTQEVIRRAPCEVIVAKAPIPVVSGQ